MIEDLIPNTTDVAMAAGKLLISEPMMQDKSFQRAVVYVCHHDALESIGYIINRLSEHSLSDFVSELNGIYFPLFIGGPVALDTIHMLHSLPNEIGGDEIADGIYWGGDMEAAIENIKLGKLNSGNCKFFIGYSGWGEGQLDAELDMKSWLVSNFSNELLYHVDGKQSWKRAISKLGTKFNSLLYVPMNPELN